MTWRILGRLQRHALVAATPRQMGGAVAGSTLPGYFLTTSGLRLAATFYPDLPARRPPRRAPFLFAHSVMATDVELAFRRTVRRCPAHELELWECDWQIAMRLGSKAVIPDARLVYRFGTSRLHAFVEVDLRTEGTRFFGRKVERYVRLYRDGAWTAFLRVWPVVLTITPTDARAASLRDATTAALD
ncbi:MAG: replication-relaxation family protein [Chloroflexota bacterium]|nr:replication-relaxation family protein [Chloroflexota bacterium]